MEWQLTQDALETADVDALIVFRFSDDTPEAAFTTLDTALSGALADLVAVGDFTGEAGQVAVFYPRGAIAARRVVAVGLGDREAFTLDDLRRVAATGARKARELKARSIAMPVVGEPTGGAEAIVEGATLALYDFRGQKGEAASPSIDVARLHAPAESESGLRAAAAIAAGVRVTRDLVNQPPNICTPAYMAQIAAEVAEAANLKFEALERRQMESLGMGALLGVAQGSDTPPTFIILEHNAARAAELPTLVLVGKGVTFDTGGYSLKPRDGMVGMKADMAGGAAVIGAMRAIGGLNVPLHVVGLVPAADNMVSGKAYRPQEVLRASNGVTIEIISTDAEGRLLLADALVFARRYEPAAVVDIATLTGACVVALGTAAGGLFATDDALTAQLRAAGDRTGERVWPLPLYPEYNKQIKSQVADVKNSGGRFAGAATAAAFLQHFVDFPAWAHIDMAGMAGIEGMGGSDTPYLPKEGATGYGARLLADFVRNWSA
jgi:leucyl aminopeptidase